MKGTASGKSVSIVHSDHYKTSFSYNWFDHTYKMQMYSRISGQFEKAVVRLFYASADGSRYAGSASRL